MVVHALRWALQCKCLYFLSLFFRDSRDLKLAVIKNYYVVVTIDFILFVIKMSTAQCKMQTVDCRVQTGCNV